MSKRCDRCIIFALPDEECLFYGTPIWCVNMKEILTRDQPRYARA